MTTSTSKPYSSLITTPTLMSGLMSKTGAPGTPLLF